MIGLCRYVLGTAAIAAMLAACGGLQPPAGARGATSQGASTRPAYPHGLLYAGIIGSKSSSVSEYPFPYVQSTGGIKKGIALADCCDGKCVSGMAIDAAGELFVANYNNDTITGYATPAYRKRRAGTLLTIISNVHSPCDLAVDSNDDVFVTTNGYGGDSAYEYAPPYGHATHQFTAGNWGISWIGVGPNNNFFVQTKALVYEYLAPHWHVRIIRSGLDNPKMFAFDQRGNLFVANVGNSTITEYACCDYARAPLKTLRAHFEGLNQVFIYQEYVCYVNHAGSSIICLLPPDYKSTETITTGIQAPGFALVDANYDLLVSNGCCSEGMISEYQWPWASASNGGNLYQTIHANAWPMGYLPL